MTAAKFKYIYGPVYSWRMGMSLGIDPLSLEQKYCNFGCPYCQLGSAPEFGVERKVFVMPEDLAAEIRQLPQDCIIDYMTFSGNGEPTLALNLGELITTVKGVRPGRVAIISNGVLAGDPQVQKDMQLADYVLLKLDAADEAALRRVNLPAPGVTLKSIIEGISSFRNVYRGKLALQIMLVGHNKNQAEALAAIARAINPDEVQLNTPLRPSPVKPLSPEEMAIAMGFFTRAGLPVLSVYDEEKKFYEPYDAEATRKRHGRYGVANNKGTL